MPKDSSGSNCAGFTLDTITTTNSAVGYNIKAYNKTTDSNITIKKQDGTAMSTNPNNPTEIISIATTSTNDKKTTAYQACADGTIADGSYNTEIAYVIAENIAQIACVSGTQFKGNVGNMQNIDVSSWNQGDTGIATDTRNGQEYCIGKLKDNKTWMLDNLKLELKPGMTLTSDTTNVPEFEPKTIDFAWGSFTSGTYDDSTNFVKTGYLTRSGDSSSASPNYDAWRQVDPGSTDTTLYGGSRNCDPQGTKINCGYLYNYYTATVGSAAQADYSNGEGRGYIAQQSICPSGWKLPSGQNASGDFGILDNSYKPGGTGSNHSLANPDTQGLWLSAGAWRSAFGGSYVSGLGGQGSGGYYWTSSARSATDVYSTYFDSSNVYSGIRIYDRYGGFAVRCLVG
ncbi:MAG: fibrobacter succinogenes major paralogous domain-containing protein [Candidatus Nomurabacteria bacterium]|nr:fibrobacter succinogenes major paralogous domain-containing protein [Candidatus Nomurabacteria bacterium]